jgi:hypothetical protein
VGGDIIWDILQNPGKGWQYAYVGLTRNSARGIVWNMMKKLDRKYKLGARFLEGHLRTSLMDAEISLHGADKAGWMDRLLGHEFRKVVIDEAGFYSIDLNKFIEELRPTVIGTGGSIIMCSTPGHIPRGHFFDVTTGKVEGWSNYRWSSLDNPYIAKDIELEIARLKRENPEVEREAFFRRNYLGEWVTEFRNKVYKFDAGRNTWEGDFPSLEGWTFVLGVDLGWHDATALVVVGWHPNRKELFVAESFRSSELLISDVASLVKKYQDFYPNLVMVGDPSHRQAFEELRRRWQLPIKEADKASKEDWQALINSDLEAGDIKLWEPQSSPLAEEWMELVWDERPNGTVVEAARIPNDTADAFLYAYRTAYHYRHTPPVQPIEQYSKDYWDEQARKMEEEAEEKWDRENPRNMLFFDD